MILDYGDDVRCSLTMNHTHDFGSRFAVSQLKVEGTRGAARRQDGREPQLSPWRARPAPLCRARGDWQPVPLRGSWFPDAFDGPMSNLQRFVAGEDAALVSPVDDAFRTMAVVEACYESSARGATPIPEA